MMSPKTPTQALSDWPGGSIAELAETAGRLLDDLGKPEDTLASANDLGKRIRVIRDYAQRGILSDDAERRGKELFYDVRHLNQLVAARMLANEGVSLAAIAKQFQEDPEVVVMTLGLNDSQENRAMATWQRMRHRSRRQPEQPLEMMMSLSEPLEETEEASFSEASTTFLRRTSESRGRRVELRQLLDDLGAGREHPKVRDTTHIEVTDWCQITVDNDRLQQLSRSELDNLGRAIAASLLKARSRRGGN